MNKQTQLKKKHKKVAKSKSFEHKYTVLNTNTQTIIFITFLHFCGIFS